MNVFELMATISLDSSGYDKGLDEAEGKAKTFGGGVASGIAQGFTKVVGAGVKAVAAATAAAAGAVGTLGVSAVKSFAEYEQLVGGVDKLFGEASQSLQAYADRAYLTAGMSANAYMESATSFSAALINSLGGDTQKAADMTDVAMRAMSDNVNTFGSSMDSVQTAFQGFAKQNYTMLDNLKLGYGGTKEEMQRLIDDANEYRASIGQSSDLSIKSFADIVQAIESVQEKQGIAGTTSKEAMKTLEGSANATKAAWQNVVTAIGRGEGLKDAMDGLVSSVFGATEGEGLLNQVIPRIQTVFEGIGTFVETASPYITDKLPGLVGEIVPQLIKTALSTVKAVGAALPAMVSEIITSDTTQGLISNAINAVQDVAARIKDALPEAVSEFADSLRERLTDIIPVAMEMLVGFSDSLRENVGLLVDAGLEMVTAIADGIIANIPVFVETIPTIVSNIANIINENMPKILMTGARIIISLVGGIISAIPVIIANIPKIVRAIADVITAFNWLNIGKNIIKLLTSGVKNLASMIPQALRSIVQSAGNIIKTFPWGSVGRNIITMLANGVRALASRIPQALRSIGSRAMSAFRGINWGSLGSNLISGIVGGIGRGAGRIASAARNAASNALKAAKNFLGIKSPSRVFRDQVGLQMARGMALGFERGIDGMDYQAAIDDMVTDLDTDYGVVDAGSVTVNTSDGYMRSLLGILEEYLPALAQSQIVLSTGEMVGALAPAMSTEIGRLNLRQTRREGIR